MLAAGSAIAAPISFSGSYNAANEWFSLISMDGNTIATNFHPSITGFNGSNDVDISTTFTISGGMMASMTADGDMTIIIDLAANVSAGQPDDPFIAMTLSYEPYIEPIQIATNPPPPPPYNPPSPPTSHIAEPATLALFGLGLAGIGFARRRRSA
jgi:hypothetical protein